MKPPEWSNCTEEELWKFVAWHLARENIESTLVGGAVVSVYSQGAYRSGDLDFIISDHDHHKIAGVLQKIGFKKEGRHYIHPECHHLFLEFPPGPLAIGSDYKIIPATKAHQKQILRILSPTDCVCDRLASYIHSNPAMPLTKLSWSLNPIPSILPASKNGVRKKMASNTIKTFFQS